MLLLLPLRLSTSLTRSLPDRRELLRSVARGVDGGREALTQARSSWSEEVWRWACELKVSKARRKEGERERQLTDLAGETGVARGTEFGAATGSGLAASCERVVLAFEDDEPRMPPEGGVANPEPPMRGEPGENSMRICASLGVRVLGLVPASGKRNGQRKVDEVERRAPLTALALYSCALGRRWRTRTRVHRLRDRERHGVHVARRDDNFCE
jgi:hypothetical protein